jgi:hypothetical protein
VGAEARNYPKFFLFILLFSPLQTIRAFEEIATELSWVHMVRISHLPKKAL